MENLTITIDSTKLEVIEFIKMMNSAEILELNNLFCELANYHDNHIYYLDEEFFEEIFCGSKDELARSIFYGDFSYSHDYVFFNGYGNLETKSYLDYNNLPDFVDNIAQYIIDNFSDFEQIF